MSKWKKILVIILILGGLIALGILFIRNSDKKLENQEEIEDSIEREVRRSSRERVSSEEMREYAEKDLGEVKEDNISSEIDSLRQDIDQIPKELSNEQVLEDRELIFE